MAVRDIVVLNTTASRLEAQQSSDTVRIKGTSAELLSIENSSGTSVFSVNAPSSSITITGNLTASGDFSSSLASTASFGRVEATTVVGSAAGLTNAELGTGIVSSSAQMAANISGSFQRGITFTGTIGKAVGVWSAGGAMSIATKAHAGAGLRNAAISFGGSPNTANTLEYNGSTWSAGGDMVTGQGWVAGAGSLTAALAIGGSNDQDDVQKYNGTAWSETGNLILGRYQMGAAGTQNAAIGFGGFTPACSPGALACTETFNGSTWSETADMITARMRFGATGTQNAAIGYGGEPTCTCTEEWNGGVWSAGSALITGAAGISGGGTVNTALSIGGTVSTKACVEEYNGMSWSVGGLLIQGRSDGGGAGSQDSAAYFGGCDYPGNATVACTEEYDGYLPITASFGKLCATSISGDAKYLTNTTIPGTISGSAQIASDISGSFQSGFSYTGTIGKREGVWSSGTALPSAIKGISGAGNKAAALYFGGYPGLTGAYHYNGSSWSAGSALPVATFDSLAATSR